MGTCKFARALLLFLGASVVLAGCAMHGRAADRGTGADALAEVREYDPWEPFNERTFAFNRTLDRRVVKPAATGWRMVVPEPFREGIQNALHNLSMPSRFVNNLLQLKVADAGREVGGFVVNSTLGLGGLVDIAQREGWTPRKGEDTGQTLAVYGVGPGPYLVLPFFPPSTVREWLVRHVVVDTGHWLPGRQVLVAPRLITGADRSGHRLETALTREQVRTSPPSATDTPVSSQRVIDPETYMNTLFFWTDGDLMHSMPAAAVSPAAHHEADRHLYSVRGITNYTVHAIDGDIGHVGDVVVDDESWAIDSIVVDMRRWLPGKHVVVPSTSVAWISWLELTAHLRVSADAVRNGALDDPEPRVSRGAAA